ncbi:helix-turn-helix transcriptional regulator [Limosilactobacillus coleohominis]|uniref:helix-turn-helix domain-containing protein n=1 Tax=Limosilactobacillus coleohominis TaxID=181675 RepID=UPI002A91FE40|nr:helix-turn-helix transcriptional regulator [Limosilactobacillus coleohominis]MDY5628910.1 helix-turn-helix transcriptional regulator [Limosilactobacillus coleohominis]
MDKSEKKPRNRIAELRKHKGLTIQQVADGIGVSNGTISRYEKGSREPKLETWLKLANFFNVPVSYLQGVSNISKKDKRDDLNAIVHLKGNTHTAKTDDEQLRAEFISFLFNVLFNDKDRERYKKYYSDMVNANQAVFNNMVSDLSFLFRLFIKKNFSNDLTAQKLYKDWQGLLVEILLADEGKIKTVHKSHRENKNK